ncbi:MAG: hypothetical protein KAJ55_09000 [Anaerolineales bacterium]|nr:hypothetical protein [Anaerolineales bacterium]
MKLDERSALAFTNLRSSRDFSDFLTWLTEYEAKETQRCVDGDGAELHRAQGGVKVLQRIHEAYAEAPPLLEKFKLKQ